MNVKYLNPERDGTQSVEIRSNEVSFGALVRHIRAIPGVTVSDVARDVMNDNAKATVEFRGEVFDLETPFSDFVISSRGPTAIFDEFVKELTRQEVKWWERGA